MLTQGIEMELSEWSRDGAWPEMEPDSSRAEIRQQHCRGPAAAGPEMELRQQQSTRRDATGR